MVWNDRRSGHADCHLDLGHTSDKLGNRGKTRALPSLHLTILYDTYYLSDLNPTNIKKKKKNEMQVEKAKSRLDKWNEKNDEPL